MGAVIHKNLALAMSMSKSNFNLAIQLLQKMISDLDRYIANLEKDRIKNIERDGSTPVIPPKEAMTDKEKAAELDRILQEHGIEPKDASAEQKDFYGQFIDKTPEEIAKAVAEVVKNASELDPRIANEMGVMTGVLEGADPNVLNKMKDELQAEGLPYEMMATEHIAAIIDGLAINGVDFKDMKIPPKLDIFPKDPKDLASLTAMFAYEQIMRKVNAQDLVREGSDFSSIIAAAKSLEKSCRERSAELGLDITKEGAVPIRRTIEVLKEGVAKKIKENEVQEPEIQENENKKPEHLVEKSVRRELLAAASLDVLKDLMDKKGLTAAEKKEIVGFWQNAGSPQTRERRQNKVSESGLMEALDAEIANPESVVKDETIKKQESQENASTEITTEDPVVESAEPSEKVAPKKDDKYIVVNDKMKKSLLARGGLDSLITDMASYRISPIDQKAIIESWVKGEGHRKQNDFELKRREKVLAESDILERLDADIAKDSQELATPEQADDNVAETEAQAAEQAPELSVEELENIATDPNKTEEERAKAMAELEKINQVPVPPVVPGQTQQNGNQNPEQQPPVMEENEM